MTIDPCAGLSVPGEALPGSDASLPGAANGDVSAHGSLGTAALVDEGALHAGGPMGSRARMAPARGSAGMSADDAPVLSRIQQPSPAVLAQAATLLQQGLLVAFPTETVYGLGADAANPEAVARIFAAKGRPSDHPVIVHVGGVDDLPRWAAEVPEAARALAARYWPGPLTLILRRAAGVPDAVTGGQDTVGVRAPDHAATQALLAACRAAGGSGGLAGPSANRYGRVSPTTARHVAEELGDAVAMILDGGACDVGIESTIIDLSGDEPALLRPGHISAEALAETLGRPVRLPSGQWAHCKPAAGNVAAPARAASATDASVQAVVPRVSGDKAAHYAPRTPLSLVDGDGLAAVVADAAARSERLGVWSREQPEPAPAHWEPAPADPSAYARALYATLRALDARGLDRLVLEAPPADNRWLAIADRLGRAVTGSGRDADSTGSGA